LSRSILADFVFSVKGIGDGSMGLALVFPGG